MNKKLAIAVDFDGTLCEYAFPKIGIQNEQQKKRLSCWHMAPKQNFSLKLRRENSWNRNLRKLNYTQKAPAERHRGFFGSYASKNFKRYIAKIPKNMIAKFIKDFLTSFSFLISGIKSEAAI